MALPRTFDDFNSDCRQRQKISTFFQKNEEKKSNYFCSYSLLSNHFHENFREIDFTKIMQNPAVFTGKLQI